MHKPGRRRVATKAAAEEEEHHLQSEAWETLPAGFGSRGARAAGPRGGSGAEFEERWRSAEPGRTRRGGKGQSIPRGDGRGRGRRFSRAVRHSLRERSRDCRRGQPSRRIPAAPGSRGRGGALTSQPLTPPSSKREGVGNGGTDPPQLPAATPQLGGWLPGHVLTNLASPRPSP